MTRRTPTDHQTTVLLPKAAWPALAVIKQRRGYRSRDQTVTELLREYVSAQQALAPDDRLTHVATVCRYPPPPREAKVRKLDSGKRLPMRVDRALWDTARALAFRLPGQSMYRGHKDYQARTGADAVLTAIARVEPLADPMLGTHQVVTVRQALGLWRMVVEATRTHAEREVTELAAAAAHDRNGKPDSEGEISDVEQVAQRLEQQVAWLGPHRSRLATSIVRSRLNVANPSPYLALLEEDAEPPTKAWANEVDRWNRVVTEYVEGGDFVQAAGRGATAVWRAERAVRTTRMLEWIRASGRASTPETFVVNPPSWRLRRPTEWFPTDVTTESLLTQWNPHIQAGRVLLILHEKGRFVWPTRSAADETTEPVPGFEIVVARTQGRAVHEILEIALMDGVDPDLDDHDYVHDLRVVMPAHVAHDLRLLDSADRDAWVAAARKAEAAIRAEGKHRPFRAMNHDILFDDLARDHQSDLDREQVRMAYASGVRAFTKYLRAQDHPLLSSQHFLWQWWETEQWTWPVPSIAAVIAEHALDPAAVRWLIAYRSELHHQILFRDAKARWLIEARYASERVDDLDDNYDPENEGEDEAADESWDPTLSDHPASPPPF